MKGKRRLLAQILERCGICRVLASAQSPKLTIFNFHRIRENRRSSPCLFDDGVFGPTESEFREHLVWLKANSDIISEDDLLGSLRLGYRLPARSSMITFDDGYADNYNLALRHLRELRVPAIFFIPTQSIEERKVGWWDQISYLIKKTERPGIRLGSEWIRIDGNREAAIQFLFETMKRRRSEETGGLLGELSIACGVSLPSFEEVDRELMTWEQIRAARDSGVAIGSHTHTHRVLSTLDGASQADEFRTSKAILESRLGQPVRTIAYPVGGPAHFTDETRRLVRECGYEAAFSFTHEVNYLNSPIDAFNVRRVCAPECVQLYPGMFALPKLFIKSAMRGVNAC